MTWGRTRSGARRRRRRAGARTAGLAVTAWGLAWATNRALVAVRGPSMLPTLRPGDLLVTVPVRGRLPAPGRVVVVENPTREGHLVVKRLARIEGEEVVVLGDHPDASTDSRTWGPLPRTAVRRVALSRWPVPSRRGLT